MALKKIRERDGYEGGGYNFYVPQERDMLFDNDELSPEESGFMCGYDHDPWEENEV